MQLLKLAALTASFALVAASVQAIGAYRDPKVPQNVQQTGTQWITTQDGCSYSRTQAPGFPVQWILVINPHHIGQPLAHVNCAPLLRS